jgi:hypothetical protein
MGIEGWYYLHENGDLIYKRELGGTAADIRDSDFARGMWPIDPQDRAGAWTILIEAGAAGARPERMAELAEKWHCDNNDALMFAERFGLLLTRDGNQFVATRSDFTNLHDSPAGFGDTCLAAFTELAKELGYRPSKMWGASFADLVKAAS